MQVHTGFMELSEHTGLLIISRHTESEWNVLGKWTGRMDVNLTDKGHDEARQIGTLLAGIQFDRAYTSAQKRTHQTLDGILDGASHKKVEQHVSEAFNERDYGELTGKNKWEVKEELGDEAFHGIRRGWDYPVPGGETLKDVYARVAPYFDAELLPKLQSGENILLVAHGNSIRALIKHLDKLQDEEIADVEMGFGEVLVYHFAPEGHVAHKESRRIDITPPHA